MIKISIKKNGILTHGAQFETQAEADAWISKVKTTGSWGKEKRWAKASDLTSQEIAAALDSALMQNPFPMPGEPDSVQMYLVDGEYKIETVDISAQVLEEKEKQESKEAIDLGVELMIDIRTLNKKKIAANELDFNALMVNQTIAYIERALFNGSLGTAKHLIISLTGFYSPEEKQLVINKIDAHGLKWGV